MEKVKQEDIRKAAVSRATAAKEKVALFQQQYIQTKRDELYKTIDLGSLYGSIADEFVQTDDIHSKNYYHLMDN